MCLHFFKQNRSPPNPRDQISTETTQVGKQPETTQAGKQLPPVTSGLPSQVDETLKGCPQFRILLVGRSGIGKSSLIKHIFNLDPNTIDIAHRRPGKADIEREYSNSSENPRFVAHDSMGFEAGSDCDWTRVEDFIKFRQEQALPERIHVIWLCIETPLKGSRLLQEGDDKVLQKAKAINIPIIIVFTKYDRLIAEYYIGGDKNLPPEKRDAEAKEKASERLKVIEREISERHPSVSISECGNATSSETLGKELLIKLTTVTRQKLQDVEVKLQVLWVAAQQVNAYQKIETCIREGFKKYWRNLDQSESFSGKILIDCVHRIHDDVLKVWSFNDPDEILLNTDFFTKMISFVKPLVANNAVSTKPGGVTEFGAIGAQVLLDLQKKFDFNELATSYLYDKYQAFNSTGRLLSAYIIHLILVLYRVFSDILSRDPPRPLSMDIVFKAVRLHEEDLKTKSLDSVYPRQEFTEKVIVNVIEERLQLRKSL